MMAGKGCHRLCAVALLLWLALGLPSHGPGADAFAAGDGMPVTLDCGGPDVPGDDASCPPPAWYHLCPAMLPAALALPDGRGTVAPPLADERGSGLAVRPRPPPPRLLRRA